MGEPLTAKGPKIIRWIAPLLVAGVLTACDTVSNKVTDLFEGKVELACPSHNIVADAARRVQFRPGKGHDLIDVDTEVSVENVTVECFSDINRKTLAGKLETTIKTVFRAKRGPANTNRQIAFKYFVAVTDRADKVLYREAFDLGTTFPGNETQRILEAHPVVLNIPIRSGQSGENFRILVGLILTHDQLDYNRRDRTTPTLFAH